MSTLLTEPREHIFTWNIENFKCCFEKKFEKLSSPTFLAESLHNSTWRVDFFPRGCTLSDDDSISCFLKRTDDNSSVPEIKCEFKIDVMGEDGKIIISNKKTETFKRGDFHGWPDYKERSVLLKEWKNSCENTLTVRCHLFSSVSRVKLCSENVATTKVGVDHCSFRCAIENVSTSTSLKLLKFPSTGTSQIEVMVEIPNDDIEISVCRAEGFTGSQCVNCEITLLDSAGEARDSRSEIHLFVYPNHTWEFPTFLKKSRLNAEKDKYLVDDCFTLMFEISVTNGSKSETIHNKLCEYTPENPFDRMSQDHCTMVMLRTDFNRLFTENIQSDVNLRVEDHVFPAHRAILSARSPVFFAMFNHDMAESQTGDVKVSDLDAKTMKSFLMFLYTGESEGLDYDLASKLLMAADKYGICSLKEKCAIFLKSVISLANVCDILIIADLVEHKILKSSAVEFIVKHSSFIFCSDMWKSVIKKNLLLASETVSEVSMFIAVDQMEKNPLIKSEHAEESCKSKTSSMLFGAFSNEKSSASFNIPLHSSPAADALTSSHGNFFSPHKPSAFSFGPTPPLNLPSKNSTASKSPITSNETVSKVSSQISSANRFSFAPVGISTNSTPFSFPSSSSSAKEVSASLIADTKLSSSAHGFSFGATIGSSAANSLVTVSETPSTLRVQNFSTPSLHRPVFATSTVSSTSSFATNASVLSINAEPPMSTSSSLIRALHIADQ